MNFALGVAKMIYAKLREYPSTKEMLAVLEKEFTNIKWSDQGTEDIPDAYFWVREGKLKVAVDNLASHEYQVKYSQPDASLIKNYRRYARFFFN